MCIMVAAMDCLPPSQPSKAKPLNPHAQPFHRPAAPLHHQHLHTLAAPLPSRPFFFQHVFTYHPSPFWTIYPAKVECYDASISQPPLGNFEPRVLNGVEEDCSEGKVVTQEETKLSVEDFGLVNRGLRKVGKSGKRVFSPRLRRLRKIADKEWAPVKAAAVKKGEGSRALSPSTDFEAMLGGKTSLMIKNIPNQFERNDLLRVLDSHCREENFQAKLRSDPCRSEYDFLYLPMDFGFRANLGYAFVNFTSVEAAVRFCKAFHKHEWTSQVPGSKKKICEITCAVIQGKDALKNHFEHSKFPCHTNGYLPVVLSPARDGWKRTRPTLLGRRIDVGVVPPINRRKYMLMTINKKF